MRPLLVLLVVASCKAEHRPSPSPPALPVATARPEPAAVHASPAVPGPPVAPAREPTSEPFIAGMGTSSAIPTKELSVRQVAYLYLLTVDVYLGEILDRYPGAPTGTRYRSLMFNWPLPGEDVQTKMRENLELAAIYARSYPDHGGAAAVLAYADVAVPALGGVLDLASYYEDKRYIDDEFALGRAKGGVIKALRDQLARVRPALWANVLEAWREEAGGTAGSPRAIIGSSWEACVRIGEAVAMHVDANALDAAVTACRRAVAPVAALPPGTRTDFDKILRDTAVEAGDYADGARDYYEIPSEILEITKEYLARWPKLEGARAERAPQ